MFLKKTPEMETWVLIQIRYDHHYCETLHYYLRIPGANAGYRLRDGTAPEHDELGVYRSDADVRAVA